MPGADRTRSLVCEMKKHTSKVTTGNAERSGIPRAMVWAAAPCSPRCLGLVSHRRSRDYLPQTWPQRRGDRTTRLDRTRRAARLATQPRPPHPAPTLV